MSEMGYRDEVMYEQESQRCSPHYNSTKAESDVHPSSFMHFVYLDIKRETRDSGSHPMPARGWYVTGDIPVEAWMPALEGVVFFSTSIIC